MALFCPFFSPTQAKRSSSRTNKSRTRGDSLLLGLSPGYKCICACSVTLYGAPHPNFQMDKTAGHSTFLYQGAYTCGLFQWQKGLKLGWSKTWICICVVQGVWAALSTGIRWGVRLAEWQCWPSGRHKQHAWRNGNAGEISERALKSHAHVHDTHQSHMEEYREETRAGREAWQNGLDREDCGEHTLEKQQGREKTGLKSLSFLFGLFNLTCMPKSTDLSTSELTIQHHLYSRLYNTHRCLCLK